MRRADPIRTWLAWISLIVLVLPASAYTPRATPPVRPDTPASEPAWQCWAPGDPQPCHTKPYAFSFLSPTDGWAAGDQGLMQHWDGLVWRTVDTPSRSPQLYAVDAISATAAWAVGSGGTVLRWDGTRWDFAPAPPAMPNLWDVDFLTPSDGWVVGSDGTNGLIAHWNGTAWAVDAVSCCLEAVSAISSTDVWVVGGVVLHWDGTRWTTVLSQAYLSDVKGLAADDVWAVGGYGSTLHWDGQSWTGYPVPGLGGHAHFYALSALAPDAVWAAGWDDSQGLFVAHWDGQAWSTQVVSSVTGGATGIAMVSPTDGWVAAAGPGTLLRWNGQTWNVVSGPNGFGVSDLAFLSPSDGWAVGGTYTQSLTAHWDGHTWSRSIRPTGWYLRSIALVSASDGWAVGWG